MWDALYAIALKAAFVRFQIWKQTIPKHHPLASSLSSFLLPHKPSLSLFLVSPFADITINCLVLLSIFSRAALSVHRHVLVLEPVTVVCTLFTYLKPRYNLIALCCSSSVAFWNEVCIWFLPPLQARTNALLLLRTYFLNVTQAWIVSQSLSAAVPFITGKEARQFRFRTQHNEQSSQQWHTNRVKLQTTPERETALSVTDKSQFYTYVISPATAKRWRTPASP